MSSCTTFRVVLVVALAAVAGAVGAEGQETRAPRDGERPAVTSEVFGVVTIAGTGAPARGSRVTLAAGERNRSQRTVTDESGRFRFTGLAPDKYRLTASKAGHVTGTFGQSAPGRPGTPIQLEAGQRFEANLQIARGSVITGTVVDEYGEVAPGIQVRVLRYGMQGGQRALQGAGTATTDDRGIYRVFGLQPGEYLLAATPRNVDARMAPNDGARAAIQGTRDPAGRGAPTMRDDPDAPRLREDLAGLPGPEGDETATGYAAVYYPGTTAPAQAAPIALGLSEERSGIDVQLQRVPVAAIEGVVINPTGRAVQNVQVVLVSAGTRVPGTGGGTARADGDGRFRLANVPPGQYTLMARGAVGGEREAAGRPQDRRAGRGRRPERLWAATDVAVDGRDLSNVTLSLQQGLTIAGRILFNGTTRPVPADLSVLRVNAVPVPDPGMGRELLSAAEGTVDSAGRYTIPGIIPGRYRIVASGADRDWHLESSVLDGQDTLDFPPVIGPGQNLSSSVITFTDHYATLGGTLLDGRGRPASSGTLILFPSDPRYWGPGARRIQTARPATDGTFTFGGLPTGDYRLVAALDPEPGSWFDPAFLQQIDPDAERVSLGDGERKLVTVTVRAPAR
jgi:protocatechuate 3,4-dioxygenase beta subunit